jgi:hypothetical protein
MLPRKIAGFILIAIPLYTNNCFSQDTVAWTRGMRFGCDLTRFAVGEFQPGRKAIEFSWDTEIKNNLFSTVELGLESATRENSNITYQSNGFYGRMGIDHNILKRDQLRKRDIVYIGARYGFYTMNHQTDSYMIPGSHQGDTITGRFPSRTLNGHWLEGVLGVKVEVFTNFYLGASVRTRFLLFSKKDINYPYYIPGFGKGANIANFGITYSLYYQIPLMKVKPKPKEVKKTTAPPKEKK